MDGIEKSYTKNSLRKTNGQFYFSMKIFSILSWQESRKPDIKSSIIVCSKVKIEGGNTLTHIPTTRTLSKRWRSLRPSRRGAISAAGRWRPIQPPSTSTAASPTFDTKRGFGVPARTAGSTTTTTF